MYRLLNTARNLLRFNAYADGAPAPAAAHYTQTLYGCLTSCALAQTPYEQAQRYQTLLNFIEGTDDLRLLDARIQITQTEAVRPVPNDIVPIWLAQGVRRRYLPHSAGDDLENTSTLLNIICSNELYFSERQMATIILALVRKGVNLAAIDDTPYHNIVRTPVQNTPLQALIAVSANNINLARCLDTMLRILITYQRDNARFVFNHPDNFPNSQMTPTQLLLRQGRENIALRIYRSGLVRPTFRDLQFACSSLGTTPYTDACADCIDYLLSQIRPSAAEVASLKKQLQLGTPQQYQEMASRLTSSLREAVRDKRAGRDTGGVYQHILRHLSARFSEEDIDNWCMHQSAAADDGELGHAILTTGLEATFYRQNIGGGFLAQGYYRQESGPELIATKLRYYQDNPDAQNRLAEIEQRLTRFTIARQPLLRPQV